MANKLKKIKLGSVISEKKTDKSGREYKTTYIALGRKNKGEYKQYDTTVEITVKDGSGNVIHKQTDGFLTIEDPRTLPDNLLSAGVISEEQAEKMKEQVANLPAKIKYEVSVKG